MDSFLALIFSGTDFAKFHFLNGSGGGEFVGPTLMSVLLSFAFGIGVRSIDPALCLIADAELFQPDFANFQILGTVWGSCTRISDFGASHRSKTSGFRTEFCS